MKNENQMFSKSSSNSECIFCQLPSHQIKFQNDLIRVFKDIHPVSTGHTLFISKRHVQSALDLKDEELLSIFNAAKIEAKNLQNDDPTISGFNIGFNVGKTAGQSVMHAHFHLIPRRVGDTPDPFGGIRNVIAGKGLY